MSESPPEGPRTSAELAPPGPGPVTREERIASIDVLRGFALLGILVMNIQAFSMIDQAYLNPTAYGDLTGANFAVWLLSRLLADQKFMTIFSLLFGAGIVLMTERTESRGPRTSGVHYRRMAWLIVFGMLHAHLLWYGDILYTYGMCGLVVYLFRKLPPRWLLALGFGSLAVSSAIWVLLSWGMQFTSEEFVTQFHRNWQPSTEVIEAKLAGYRGGWLAQMEYRVPAAFEFQTLVFLTWTSWRAGGLMLAGMGLYKLGVFSLRRSNAFYIGLMATAVLVGIPVVLLGSYTDIRNGWDVTYSFFHGWQFNYWGSIPVSLGWVGLVMLLCRTGSQRWLTSRLAAVGQSAFSNYILHTLICTTLFYGHGFGLYGRVERVGQIGIVAAIWAVQLAVSPLWLRRFRFGPLEWLWRTLTYLRVQPFRR